MAVGINIAVDECIILYFLRGFRLEFYDFCINLIFAGELLVDIFGRSAYFMRMGIYKRPHSIDIAQNISVRIFDNEFSCKLRAFGSALPRCHIQFIIILRYFFKINCGTGEKKNLTVITNSVELASEICSIESWNVYMPGGQLRPESMALSGPASYEILHTYHVDKTLFSCKGIDMEAAITDSNDLHAEVKHAMVRAAKQPILVVDGSKFDKVSFVSIAKLKEVSIVVTNYRPSQEWMRCFARHGIQCVFPEEK